MSKHIEIEKVNQALERMRAILARYDNEHWPITRGSIEASIECVEKLVEGEGKESMNKEQKYPLQDATKGECALRGYSLLQWGWQYSDKDGTYPLYWVQIPTEAVDMILHWRNRYGGAQPEPESCASCRFARKPSTLMVDFDCHRFPPRHDTNQFPVVRHDHWCGEYERTT